MKFIVIALTSEWSLCPGPECYICHEFEGWLSPAVCSGVSGLKLLLALVFQSLSLTCMLKHAADPVVLELNMKVVFQATTTV